MIINYIKIARPDHWIKQLFVLPGVLLALVTHSFAPPPSVMSNVIVLVLLAVLATSLIASANYVINEWLDAGFDKYHPTKKERPVVSVGLNARFIVLEYLFLSCSGLAIAWAVNVPVFCSVLALWVMGIVYNVRPLRTKDIPYVDVLSESINNALRLLVGWFAVTPTLLPPVSAIVAYWMAGAFLMATKRFAEYRMISNAEQAGLYRKSFLHYSEKRLLLSLFFYAMLSVFLCGVFLLKYRIEYVVAMPFLCGLFCFYLWMAFKADSAAQKPEKLFKERGLMLYAAFFIILMLLLSFLPLPFLSQLTDVTILGV
jgi:4-hydroxybenzoate polyprenyltransferase